MPQLLLLVPLALAASPDTGAPDTGGSDEAPIARAGSSFLAYPGENVILDGSASEDPGGAALRYVWSQIAGPTVTLVDGDTATPSFLTEQSGTHRFELVVSNGTRYSEPDQVDVVVVNPEAGRHGQEGGGCATGGGAAGWVLLAPAAALRGRRPRMHGAA